LSDYNFIAPIYDRLAHLVFGNQLNEAANYFIPSIKQHAYILILGGGSGSILEQLAVNCPNAQVTFLDASAKMVHQAQKRETSTLKIEFITSSVFDVTLADVYDVVITPFFLDMFKAKQLDSLFAQLSPHIRPGTLWLFADFLRSEKLADKLLIKSMYIFFSLVVGSNNFVVPDYEQHFEISGFALEKEVIFMNGLVAARKYCFIEHQQ
jgi:2-polyprenyl-3-methyl-5-hydroxy-6-metoxy-1,4-benzoquinol methylase